MTDYGLMFHHFHRSGEKHAQGSITAEEFGKMLEFVGVSKILSAPDWAAQAGSSDKLCITFDDALKCQFDIAKPVLDAFGLKAFFFVYSSVCEGQIENLEVYRVFRTEHFLTVNAFYAAFETAALVHLPHLKEKLAAFEPANYLPQFAFYTDEDRRFRYMRDDLLGVDAYNRVMDAMIARAGLTKETLAKGLWMTNDDLRDLSDQGHIIGLHSYSHPTRMENLSDAEQAEEYRKNAEHIARVTGAKPFAMSHPCNSYTAKTLENLRTLGISLGFCSNLSPVQNRSALEWPRQDHADILKAMRAAA